MFLDLAFSPHPGEVFANFREGAPPEPRIRVIERTILLTKPNKEIDQQSSIVRVPRLNQEQG